MRIYRTAARACLFLLFKQIISPSLARSFLFILFTSKLSIFDTGSCECERIAADNTTKLTNQVEELSNDVRVLSAEKNNFASEVEVLHRDKVNFSFNSLHQSSPSNVDVVYLVKTAIILNFMQMLRRR